jgi:hypothetical protein
VLSVGPAYVHAQSHFREGQILYRADTVRRLETQPAAYIATKLLVYQRGESTRLEVWRVNRGRPTDTNKEIHLRNGQGTYSWIEYSDSTRAALSNFALFMSYEDEKQWQLTHPASPMSPTYRLKRVVKRMQWLGLPAERVVLTSDLTKQEAEAVVTQAMLLPLKAIFPSLRRLSGTPLQFTDSDRGWRTRFTATALLPHTLPTRLFEVEPTRKLMTMKEMTQLISDFK